MYRQFKLELFYYRTMWTRLLSLDSKDHYTALLGISKASRLDEGIYTCQVNMALLFFTINLSFNIMCW